MKEERVESMLSQLITMVGSMQAEQQGMKNEFNEMKSEIKSMKSEIKGMNSEIKELRLELSEVMQNQQRMESKLEQFEIKTEKRHEEIMERFKSLERDQDFIWEKTARNEREIGNIKRQIR